MRLPDFTRSRAVIFGTARYESNGLEDLPSVARNVRAFHDVLTDKRISGFASDHCEMVIDPRVPDDMLSPLQRAADKADDVLLVYFSGHGLLTGRKHDLHFALTDTEDVQFWTSVPFQHLEDIVLGSSAIAKIVILDCCYSGRAVSTLMSDPVTAAVEQLTVEGLYVITSCSGTKTSLAPENDELTSFTGCMLNIMRTGVPHPDEYLPMDVLYDYVTKSMASSGLRKPQQRARNTAGKLALVRNIYKPATDGLPPDQAPPKEQPIGFRISRWREHRRFSTLALAQLLGRPESWVHQVESGKLRLDELSTVLQISDVLSIDLQTLLGKEPAYRARGFYSIDILDTYEIRSAMEQDYPTALLAGPTEPTEVDALTASIEVAWRYLDDAKYDLLGSEIPRLLKSALALAAKSIETVPGVASLRSQIYLIISSMLRKVGEHELSWLAADRAAAAALQVGDALLLGAAIVRVSGALLSLGRVRSALEICLEHVGELSSLREVGVQIPGKIVIYGALLLEAALAASRVGDGSSVRDLLKEAENAARLLDGAGNYCWTRFGPTNVEVFRAAAAVELGDGRTALEINELLGSGIDQLTPSMQGNHFLAMTRAALQSADLRRAVEMLLEADRRAPLEILCRPIAHEIVGDILRRSRAELHPRVTELADQIGLAGA